MTEPLHVTVLEAKALPAADHGGTSDPFCELHLGNVSHKTKVVKKNLNPTWHEEFTFHPGYSLRDDAVHFLVYDWNHIEKNHLIAQVSVPLSRFLTKGTMQTWLPLTDKHCEPLDGTLHVSIKYGHGVGPEESQGHGSSQGTSTPASPPGPILPPAPIITDLPPAEILEAEIELPPQPEPVAVPVPEEPAEPPHPVYKGPTHGLSHHEISEAEKKFYEYDVDKSLTIDRNELKPLLRSFFGNKLSDGLMERFASAEMQAADSQHDTKGQLDFKEFLELYAKLKQAIGQ